MGIVERVESVKGECSRKRWHNPRALVRLATQGAAGRLFFGILWVKPGISLITVEENELRL